MSETTIEILEIIDDVVWLQFVYEGKPIFKTPLARAIRDYLKPEYKKDVESGEISRGFRPEQAFKKLKISRAFKSEISRA